MAFFDPRDIDIQEQVKSLANEVASLRKMAAKRGHDLYSGTSETVSDYYSELSDAVRSLLPGMRRRAHAIETAAYQNPAVIAVVGLVVIGLVASVVFRSRSSVEPGRPQSAKRKRAPARSASITRGKRATRANGGAERADPQA